MSEVPANGQDKDVWDVGGDLTPEHRKLGEDSDREASSSEPGNDTVGPSTHSPVPTLIDERTQVCRWLRDHSLGEYAALLSSEGYDDLEDLAGLAQYEPEAFSKLVTKAGHRRKILRLLHTEGHVEAAPLPSPTISPTPVHEDAMPPHPPLPPSRQLPRRVSRRDSDGSGCEGTGWDGLRRTSPPPPSAEDGQRWQASSPPPSDMVITLDQAQLANLAAGGEGYTHSIVVPASQHTADRGSPPIARLHLALTSKTTSATPPPVHPEEHHEQDRGVTGSSAQSSIFAISQTSRDTPPVLEGELLHRHGSHRERRKSTRASYHAYHSQLRRSLMSESPISHCSSESSYPSPSFALPETGRFKVIVVGGMGTGKTSYIHQLVHQKFSHNTKATIGLDWREKHFKVNGGRVTVQLWDISGQERFANVTRAYYQGAHGAMVCFDRSNPKSLETVAKWKQDIDSKVFVGGQSDGLVIPCILLANKCDLENKAKVTPEDLQELCRKLKFVSYFETSAKLNYNVLQAAEFLMQAMLKNTSQYGPATIEEEDPCEARSDLLILNRGSVTARSAVSTKHEKRKCCQ